MNQSKTGAVIVLFAVICLLGLGGCQSSADQSIETDTGEVIVFAAASMTETLQKAAVVYQEKHPEVKIVFNFDSSGTLKTQIQEGADCDLFVSAAQKQMNQLQEAGLIKTELRFDILENKVVLVVPEDNPEQIQSFDDWAEKLEQGGIILAMGNQDVPVGDYTKKILAFYKIDEDALIDKGAVTYGSNVKEVTTQVLEHTVDCGIIYNTDAYTAGLRIIAYATPEMCGQIIYPAAVLKNAKNPVGAAQFLDFIRSEECRTIFEEVGFLHLKK